jgi:hypothetical protein
VNNKIGSIPSLLGSQWKLLNEVHTYEIPIISILDLILDLNSKSKVNYGDIINEQLRKDIEVVIMTMSFVNA